MTVSDDELERIIQTPREALWRDYEDGVFDFDDLADLATELLQRRQADRKWQSAATPIWGAHKVNDHYTVYPNHVFMLSSEDMYMPYYEGEPPEPPEVSQ